MVLIFENIILAYNVHPMTLDHLKLFRDVALARSMTRGAEICGVSQSAASQQLQETERLLGVDLLDRSTRPFELTEAGRLYYEFCRDVLRRKEEFDRQLDKLKGRVQGTVRVAAIYSVGISDMARLELEVGARMPEAQLLVEYLRPEKVYDAVVTDQADLGLVSYPESNREITAIPWREDKMMVAAAPSHPLAAKEKLAPVRPGAAGLRGFRRRSPGGPRSETLSARDRNSGKRRDALRQHPDAERGRHSGRRHQHPAGARFAQRHRSKAAWSRSPSRAARWSGRWASSIAAGRRSTWPRKSSWNCCGRKPPRSVR